MSKTLIRFLLLLTCGLAPWLSAVASPAPVVVCYPGGAADEQQAQSAMATLLGVLERVGHWPANRYVGLFTAKADECRRLMSERKPSFAITSLPLFLELREPHHLIPLVRPRIRGKLDETYRIVAAQGRFTALDELKGKTLGGTVLEPADFLRDIVFAGKPDPAGFFALRPSPQAIRALRALDKGELDAVLLNDQQFAALGALKLTQPLATVYTSPDIPLIGLVANRETSSAEERGSFAAALQALCGDTEGKRLCDLFGVEAFFAVDAAVYEPVIRQWRPEH